jgi:hypothetical protein
MSELQTTPGSSKDLEKDEREAMEEFLRNPLCPFRSHQQIWPAEKGFEAGWRTKGEQTEARLQQVEAERDEASNQSNIVEISDRKRAAEYDAERYRVELSIAREALEAADYLIDRLSKVTERIPVRDLDEAWAAYNKTRARLQAKGEGT